MTAFTRKSILRLTRDAKAAEHEMYHRGDFVQIISEHILNSFYWMVLQ
jgi:hypothetical protein